MKSIRRFVAPSMVWLTLAMSTERAFEGCLGAPVETAGNKLPLSPKLMTEPAAVLHPGKPVRWKDQEYEVTAGIEVLTKAVRNPETAKERELALMTLSMSSRDLGGRPVLDELAKLYDGVAVLDKRSIVACFAGSFDPRGIPIFVRALEREANMHLRVSAAAGLAQWNIRQGVAELVQMLDSTDMLPPPTGMLPYVRDKALSVFRMMNIHKGWGFPDDKDSVFWAPDVNPPADVVGRLKPPPSVDEIKKWWAENEQRFPDWNPGDPLPEADDARQAPDADTPP